MSFITTTEEMWLDQGRSQGINQGERAMLLRLLKRKFGVIPEHYMKQIEKANAESLLTWGDRVLECQEIEKIFEA